MQMYLDMAPLAGPGPQLETHMLSDNLARFLRNLSIDPSLLEAFEENPEAILADTDLSEDDRNRMRSTDRERLRQQLPTAEPLPGGII